MGETFDLLVVVVLYVAHVPPTYQVPELIKHPSALPLYWAFQYPDPDTEVPVAVGAADVLVAVAVLVLVEEVAEAPDLSGYLTPVLGQFEDWPLMAAGTKALSARGPLVTKP